MVATSSAFEQAQAELAGETHKFGHRLRMKWWRYKTRAWLLLPAVREEWRLRFRTDPSLLYARHREIDGLKKPCFQTMAGFYNDTVPQGFMTEAEARKIYTS